MIKRKKHSCRYKTHLAIIHKLSGQQLFWLCVLALAVMGIVGVFAPSAFIGLL